MNKFEQVSSDGHQMSLAGGLVMSREGGYVQRVGISMVGGYVQKVGSGYVQRHVGMSRCGDGYTQMMGEWICPERGGNVQGWGWVCPGVGKYRRGWVCLGGCPYHGTYLMMHVMLPTLLTRGQNNGQIPVKILPSRNFAGLR